MKEVHSPVKWTRSDAIAEAVSAGSCSIVLETSPPDYVEKISRYLESSAGQNIQDPASQDSDSGDSLFLTQKWIPEAVRTQRRRHSTLRSEPTFPRDLEDSEDSSCASPREDGPERKRKEKKHRLPKYSFPFLTEKKRKPESALLYVPQNTSLHNSGMGGFFKCVRELFENYRRGDNLGSSLPTVDVDGEKISPLSEGEEERSDDEDIKVVDRKCFVVSCKAKCPQPWNTSQKRDNQRKRRRAGNAGQETSQERQWKTLKPSISISSDAESTDDGESSGRVLTESGRSDKNIVAQTETPKTERRLTRGSKRNLLQQKAKEEERRDDSDATSPAEYTQLDREASFTATDDVCHADGLSPTGQPEDESGTRESQDLPQSPPHLTRDTNGGEIRVKERKKEKREHGGKYEPPEAQHAATSENVEMADAEAPAPQACDELELNENNQMENSPRDDNTLRREDLSVEDGVNERETPPLKQKKKKRKKNKLAEENGGQEEEGCNLECDVRMEDSEEEEKKKKKKKKRKRSGEHEEDVEQFSSGTVAEPLNDDAEIRRKKKKSKKEKSFVNTEEASNSTLDQLEELESCVENPPASQETSDSGHVKRKKHKKKKESSCHDATQAGEEDVGDVSTSNDAAGKKKKKNTDVSICDGIEMSAEEVADETQKTTEDAELVTKKKKKKKKKRMSETSDRNISEDTVAQSHDSVSVREKEKEKEKASSFLAADAEGNCAQTQRDKSSPSLSVAVSTGDFETESAEMAGNASVTESNDGVRKKKRKRKVPAEDHEQDFEEPNETCRSDLPETTDAGAKRKKKRRRDESELVPPVERPESAADEGHSQIDEAVVLKKKKKKKKKKIQENSPTVIEDAESEISTLTSHKKKQSSSPLDPKSKHGLSAERSHDSRTSDQEGTPDFRDKKKKCTDDVLPEGKSVELESHKHKKKEKKERNNPAAVPSFISSSSILSETDSPSRFEMSSSDNIKKNKSMKAKRRLHNPSEDFFTQ